jgi:predicted RNase H-like nuclease (RuvC/YqgF family)
MADDGRFVALEKDVEHLKKCCDQFGKMKNGDHAQDKLITEMKSEIKSLEDFMESHKEWHDKLDTKKDDRNWQIWLLIITVVVTSIGSIIVMKIA